VAVAFAADVGIVPKHLVAATDTPAMGLRSFSKARIHSETQFCRKTIAEDDVKIEILLQGIRTAKSAQTPSPESTQPSCAKIRIAMVQHVVRTIDVARQAWR